MEERFMFDIFVRGPIGVYRLPDVGVQPGEHAILAGVRGLQEDSNLRVGEESKVHLPALRGARLSQ